MGSGNGLSGFDVGVTGEGDGAQVVDLLFEGEDGVLGGEYVTDVVVYRLRRLGNSSRKAINLRNIRERGELVGRVSVRDLLDATVSLEHADLAQGGLEGPFPAKVLAVDLFEIGFVSLVGFEGAEGGFFLAAAVDLPVGGDEALEGEVFEGAAGDDFVS